MEYIACDMEAGLGSEWNSLMYRISEKIPSRDDAYIGMESKNGRFRYTHHGGSQLGDNWANYTYQELSINPVLDSNGIATWCVETIGDNNVNRGFNGVASFAKNLPTSGNEYYGPFVWF